MRGFCDPSGQLGYADQAQQRCQEALALAQHLGHTPSLAFVAILCRRARAVPPGRRGHVCTRRRVDDPRGHPRLCVAPRAGAHAAGVGARHAGRRGVGVAHIRQGLAASQGVGPETLRPHWLALLAEAYGRGWTARARPGGTRRGLHAGGDNGGALVGGRVVSSQGGTAAPTPEPRCEPGGSLFPAGTATWPVASRPRHWNSAPR